MPRLKLRPEKLTEVAEAVYNKARFSGTGLARACGVGKHTLYLQMHQHGVPVETADLMADCLQVWATQLMQMGADVRAMAQKEREAPNPKARKPHAVKIKLPPTYILGDVIHIPPLAMTTALKREEPPPEPPPPPPPDYGAPLGVMVGPKGRRIW